MTPGKTRECSWKIIGGIYTQRLLFNSNHTTTDGDIIKINIPHGLSLSLPYNSTDIIFACYINGIFCILLKGHNSVSNEIQPPVKLFQDTTAYFQNNLEGGWNPSSMNSRKQMAPWV